MKSNNAHFCFLVSFFCFILSFHTLWAGQESWYNTVDNRFGGQFRLQGGITGYDNTSYFEPVGTVLPASD